ncbi:MAG: DUF2764 family protein [Spirochaetales bacterium]|nr:DUF2764 family protein [Spirochaetales bacterium]
MSEYYYLVATLPMLRKDMSEYMSHSEFLSLCKDKVTMRDYKMLENATLSGNGTANGKFMKDFTHFRSMVEKELAFQRANKLKIKDAKYENKGDKESKITERIRKAVSEDNPLEGEKIILGLYWDYLEEHIGNGHYFDITFLLGYSLRLQILSRLSLFDLDKGNAEFERLFGNLRTQIFQ